MADGDSRAGAAPVRLRSGRPEQSRGPKPSRLDIDILLPAGIRAPGLSAWLQSVAPARARGSVTIAVVPDARVRALNRGYRKKDTNTDVLSFPAEGPTEGPAKAWRYRRNVGPGFIRATPGPVLGDVVIAAGVARRQASQFAITPVGWHFSFGHVESTLPGGSVRRLDCSARALRAHPACRQRKTHCPRDGGTLCVSLLPRH